MNSECEKCEQIKGNQRATSNKLFSFCRSFEKEHVFTFKFYTLREWIWNFPIELTAIAHLFLSFFFPFDRSLGHCAQCSISNENWKVENEHSSALISFIWCLCGVNAKRESERFNNNERTRVCIELFRSFSVHASIVSGHTLSIFFSRQFHFAWQWHPSYTFFVLFLRSFIQIVFVPIPFHYH